MKSNGFFKKALALVCVYGVVTCQPVLGAAGTCEEDLARPAVSEFEKLGGVVIRLHKVHHDGFGDVMNALSLGAQIKRQWPSTPVSLILDETKAYVSLTRRFHEFNYKTESNIIDGVEIVDGRSPRADELYWHLQLEIFRVPAGPENYKGFEKGTRKYNIYLEEPGADDKIDFAYIQDFPRNKPVIDSRGRLHLRLSPGIGPDRLGVDLPKIQLAKRDRKSLIEEIEKTTGMKLPSDIAKARWGFSYHHSAQGEQGRDYFAGLYDGLQAGKETAPVYIFDFSEAQPKESGSLAFLGIGDPITTRFNHIYKHGRKTKGWIGLRKSPYTIVHIGAQSHDLFLQMMSHSDLPVLVTGTQSLLEAISLETPFYYDLLGWKEDLAIGIVKLANEKLNAAEAEFISRLFIGPKSLADIDLRYNADGKPVNWEQNQKNRQAALVELMNFPERQALLRKVDRLIKDEPRLTDSLNRIIGSLPAISPARSRSRD